jgi:hypothetical protein
MDPKLVPFGGEAGSGDSLVLDVKTGRVLYWDHEEGEADASNPSPSRWKSCSRAPSSS